MKLCQELPLTTMYSMTGPKREYVPPDMTSSVGTFLPCIHVAVVLWLTCILCLFERQFACAKLVTIFCVY